MLGGALYWNGTGGNLIDSVFTDNNAAISGGGVAWYGANGILTGSTFNGNNATYGGGLYWHGANGSLSDSSFTNNRARINGGGSGGAVYWWNSGGILSDSIFAGNTAPIGGGAISLNNVNSIINCSFINNKFVNNNSKSNGILTLFNLVIGGGSGIVDLVIGGDLSGTSIVVLNNETYYYPPNANINLIYLQNHEHETVKDNLQNNQ